jgi:MarR family transcriptional regulator, organic hydroperoxide resistance regulator
VVTENEPGGVILDLQRATHVVLHALAVSLAALDLNASEINVLANLADGFPRTVGQLVSGTAIKPTTLTSVLDRLVGRGHVIRELDPADRRSFVVSLTGEGRRAAAACRAALHDLERTALATVSDADLTGFRQVTAALARTEAAR